MIYTDGRPTIANYPQQRSAIITVGEIDEDGYRWVKLSHPDGSQEVLSLPYNEVGDFIASTREVEAMRAEAAAQGLSLVEYALAPYGPEWEREQEERFGR